MTKLRRPLLIAGILLLFSILLSMPNFLALREGTLLGTKLYQDTSYHLMRLQSIYDGLKGGTFSVKIYPNTLNGYGYASPLFYPDFFLYLPASWMLLGLDLGTSYSIFMCLTAWSASILFYLFAKKFCKTPYAVVSACLYVGGNYTYSVFFYMNAVGQALAATFAPLLLLGIYNMIKEGFDKPWLLLLGVLGITYSHTISLFLWGIALVVTVLVHYKLMLDGKWWLKVGIMIVLYVGLSAMYFFPMLEQFLATDFYQSVSPWAVLSNQATRIEQVFFRIEPFNITEYSIGMIFPVCFLLRIAIRPKKGKRIMIDLMIVAVILSQIVASSIFPWDLLEQTIFSVLQFPSRILMLTAPLSALAVGMILEECEGKWKRVTPILSLFIVLGTGIYDCYFLPPEGKTDLSTESLYSYVGGGEWYPVYEDCYGDNVVYVLSTSDRSIRGKRNEKIKYDREENTTTISFVGEEGITYSLPLIYYKGYTAIDENGVEQKVAHDGYGKLQVESSTNQTIKVEYTGTTLQKISEVLTICAIPISACYYVFESKKRILK